MAIAFKDFKQECSGFLNMTQEPLPQTLERANKWIKDACIEVLNVETLYSTGQSQYQEGIRVWYSRP